jgi:hypothetical protein
MYGELYFDSPLGLLYRTDFAGAIDGFSPSSRPCLYLAVIVLFLLPRLPLNVGDAVDAGGRGVGA